MIKTKEDLRMTFVRNEGAVAKKWIDIVDCRWIASFDNSYYLCLDKNCRAMYMPKYNTLSRSCSAEWLVTAGYREVTLEDFELGAIRETTPEDIPEKFTPIKGSLTGIKVRINSREQWGRLKELYESVGLEHAAWSGCGFNSRTTTFMCGHEGYFLAETQWEDDEYTSQEFSGLREVLYGDLFVEEGRLLTREKVKWQDEVLDYLRMPSVDGFEEELPTKITVSFDDEDFYLTDSEFLEAARIALKAVGELK